MKIENVNFTYFLALRLINLFFWYYSLRKMYESPRNYWVIFIAIFAYVISGSILNDYKRDFEIPLWVDILLFIPYVISIVVVHHDHKRDRKGMEEK
jgi:hypothetical protein